MSQDARDLRDPQKMGNWYLKVKSQFPKWTATEIFDSMDGMAISNYPQDELLSTVTQREYREELQQAAKEGDKYAAERLREL
jgi:hypothetical protein